MKLIKAIMNFIKVGFVMLIPFALDVFGEIAFKNISGETMIQGLIAGSIIVVIILRCYIKILERR